MKIHACAAIAVSLLAGHAVLGQSGNSLLVLSKHDHTLAVVNPTTLQVTSRVPVGNDPHEVIASADGTRAYVSNYGFGAFHTLAVVDLVNDKAMPSIDLGALRGPHGLIFQGGKTWFTAEAAKALGRYDPATDKVDLILGTGQNHTHMIWVSRDGQQIVTTNVSSGTVSIFTQEPIHMGPPPGSRPPGGAGSPSGPPPGAPPMPRTDWNETVVRVGNGSEGFDVSPNGKEIWVANAQDGTVSVVSLLEKKVLETLQVDAKGANRLKFTPDGRTVLVSSGPELIVLDAASQSVKARVPIGHGSGGVLVEPDGKRAFVACGPDNFVVVIDLQTLKVTGHIDAGGEPDGMAWVERR
jgi:YVTN family beta-propeller protein